MKVIFSQPAAIAIRTLPDDERAVVSSWCQHLENWEIDSFIQKQTHRLSSDEAVYVLRTSSDIRIFFTLQKEHIVVLDIARRSALQSFAAPVN